nr:peptidylprolyl isomerase [Kofleriaceae bacterium]
MSEGAAVRARIARDEARRGAGIDALTDAADHETGLARLLALRGLGRSGGAKARAALRQALGSVDPQVVAAAAAALGVAGALGDDPPGSGSGAVDAALTSALVDALARAGTGATRRAVLEAIGRAGDPATATAALVAALRAGGDDAATVAFAFGRFGRRKLAWRDGHAEIIAATTAGDPVLRYAATYALAREFQPDKDDGGVAALTARVGDADAEVRAVAITGLARRDAVAAHEDILKVALADRDWRVQIEAVRALAGEHGTAGGRRDVATMALAFSDLATGDPRVAQVAIEALRTLADNKPDAELATAFVSVDKVLPRDPLARGWVQCLVADIQARASNRLGALASCSADLPDAYRLPLVAEVVTAGIGTLAERRDALAPLVTHKDARVRGAALGALASLYKDSAADDRDAIAGTIAAALADRELVARAGALDAADALVGAMQDDAGSGGTPQLRGVDVAVVARADTETDVETEASALAVVAKHHLAGAAEACRSALHKHPVIARAGAACLRTLGEPDAALADEPLPAEPPPVDLAAVLGHQVTWTMHTTRGDVVIALRPDVAPWGVAAIAALTKAGFYDNLDVHRVVPDFVAQGGDPTNSGMGGPDFLLPAEPSSMLDGPGFVTGGVGLADSGPDSAGSQWFVMHSRAPHLDSRYTWVGSVVSGQNVVDSLLLGDRVLHATVSISALSQPSD